MSKRDLMAGAAMPEHVLPAVVPEPFRGLAYTESWTDEEGNGRTAWRSEGVSFTGLNVQFATSEAGDGSSIWVVSYGEDRITQL